MAQDSKALMTLANQERTKLGIPPLQWDEKLAYAALDHANWMAQKKAIEHQFPNEPELAQRAAIRGVKFSKVAENIAEVPELLSAHDAWMNSPHHKANLLDPLVDTVGIAFVERDGEFYVAQDFSRSVPVLNFDQQEARVADLLRGSSLQILNDSDSVDAARKTCALDTGWAGSHKPWFVMRWVSGEGISRLPDELIERLQTGKYGKAAIGACHIPNDTGFTTFNLAVMLFK